MEKIRENAHSYSPADMYGFGVPCLASSGGTELGILRCWLARGGRGAIARGRCRLRDGGPRGRFLHLARRPARSAGRVRFFASCGWRHSHDTLDPATDLACYRPPPAAFERAAGAGVSLRRAASADMASVLA